MGSFISIDNNENDPIESDDLMGNDQVTIFLSLFFMGWIFGFIAGILISLSTIRASICPCNDQKTLALDKQEDMNSVSSSTDQKTLPLNEKQQAIDPETQKQRVNQGRWEYLKRLRFEMRNKRKSENETFAEYGFHLRRLAFEAYPNLPLATQEALSIKRFIQGLPCSCLQAYVREQRPEYMYQAVSAALNKWHPHLKSM